MDEQFKAGFGQMLAKMSEPPTWERVSAHHLTPETKSRRTRGPLVVLASFVVTVAVIVAGIAMIRGGGGSDAIGSSTVAYVKLAWSQEVELRCQGLESVDNGGFDSATIEIWGPNAQSLIRVDATAPDGTVERLIVEPDPLSPASPLRVWSSVDETVGSGTVFLTSGCLQEEPSGGTHFRYLTTSPVLSEKYGLLAYFVALPIPGEDGTPLDVVDRLASTSNVREAEWRGMPVTVYERSDSGGDSFGAYEEVIEIWLNPAERRYERKVHVNDQELLGSLRTTTEVVERDAVPAGTVSFSIDGFTLSLDHR